MGKSLKDHVKDTILKLKNRQTPLKRNLLLFQICYSLSDALIHEYSDLYWIELKLFKSFALISPPLDPKNMNTCTWYLRLGMHTHFLQQTQ